MAQYEIELILWDSVGLTSTMTLIVDVDSLTNQPSSAMAIGLSMAKKFLLPHIEAEVNGCRRIKNSNFND